VGLKHATVLSKMRLSQLVQKIDRASETGTMEPDKLLGGGSFLV